MHLDKLEISGFKSFKNKTVLEFPDKYTSIIGPNGSGKSNIIDAICFVLGRSRGLRVNNVSELICNGGKDGRPCKEAKVTLHLSRANGEGEKEEKKISREIDRSGKSVYRIDDKAASRQEIIEILGDNEYNIILQGDVNKVIDMKPKERRKIIDDLCGIGEYDAKKEKALGELEKVETKISEVSIVIGEKQSYLEVLSKEKDEAMKFQELQSEQKKTQASVYSMELEDYAKKEAKILEKIEKLKALRQQHAERILAIKTETADKNRRLKEINSEIIKLEEKKGATKIVEIKGEIIRSQEKLESAEKDIEGINKEEAEKKEKKKALHQEASEIASEIKKLEKEMEPLAEKIKVESEKITVLEGDKELDKTKTEVFESRSKIATATEMIQRDESEIAGLAKERQDLEEKKKESLAKEKDLAREIDEHMLKNKSGFDEYEKLKTELPETDKRIRLISKELEESQIKHAEKTSELKTIERASNHLGSSVTAVMNLKTIIKGIYGPVSQLGSVSNHDYQKALEIAAGTRLQNIVVENEDVAAKCIEYLRKKKIGRATFLPLNKINYNVSKEAPPESMGFARDYITAPAKFEKIFNYVYGDTVLVKDIDKAKKIGIGRWRMVTLDADLITKEGAMTGGHTEELGIKFSATDELEKEIAALQKQNIRLDGERQELEHKKKRIEEKIAKLEESVSTGKTGIEKIKLEKEALGQRREELSARIKEIDEKTEKAKKKVAESSALIKKLSQDIESGERRLEKMAKKTPKIDTSALDELREKKHGLDIERSGLIEKNKYVQEQLAEIEKGLEELKKQHEQTMEGQKKQKEVLAGLKEELSKIEKENEKLIKEVEALIDERTKTEEDITKISQEAGELEFEVNKSAEDMGKQEIEKAKLETKFTDLKTAFQAYEGIETYSDRSLSDLRSRLTEVEKELSSFGSINMRAIESYDILNKEIMEVSEKLETLKAERQSIFDFMEAVEQRKTETFMKAFEIIKANFETIFMEMSGGEGTLILDDPRSISDSGLIITASPKGKKLMNIDLMSGGEKVLTTSAFLLAIQRYKPSHFYIVDELDAALDKENSVKLAEMLSKTEAQFLMITHNDALIKYAQSVIGISMIDGVSQVVGVKLN